MISKRKKLALIKSNYQFTNIHNSYLQHIEKMNQLKSASSSQEIKIQKIVKNELNQIKCLQQSSNNNQPQHVLQEKYFDFDDHSFFSEDSKQKQNSYHDDQINNSKNVGETESCFSYYHEGQENNNDLVLKLDKIDKNNISKNIIKAFFKYLLNKNNDLLIDFALSGAQPAYAHKLAKNFINSYNYNNSSLHKLIYHPKYGKAFEFYLTFEAEQWLSNSKVKQKQAHLIFIDYLKLCCCNPEYSNHLISYKKTKKSLFNDRQ
ncbi:hypothetical protein TTHERM_01104840 (macronuclear) [Tetrahymena thermophila SB210]|uniref:Uncharacterized protein n=1 Tax=Tetrahymena thermophila (strain SB210) TaxID=312017 RepID=Q24D75_TETTS|nr:hypothetical protein TTHERM_01104840 [Tetrahymena thermophila SB210]EAS05714.2 hypothetical protein TTHERM_01104840 [Tetrahymena thermophila SB210]|eukprot:XP_001025959.2 hypothetical protein TTHERM_01104840 [Tetrahymena thermophila SB210]